jgi:hypothetical protein
MGAVPPKVEAVDDDARLTALTADGNDADHDVGDSAILEQGIGLLDQSGQFSLAR